MVYIVNHFDITNVDLPLSVRITKVDSDELFNVCNKEIVESRLSSNDILSIINDNITNELDICTYTYGLSLGDIAYMCEIIGDELCVCKIETFF